MKKVLSVVLVFALAFALTACSISEMGARSQGENQTEGRIGDTLHTIFFDYTVNSAQWVDEVNGYTASEGNALLDVELTIKNTFKEEIPMGVYDFQAQWNDEAEDAFAFQPEGVSGDNIMPETFNLKRAETVTYHVIYEVPEGSTDLSISTMDYYTNEKGEEVEGDTYFVFFELE